MPAYTISDNAHKVSCGNASGLNGLTSGTILAVMRLESVVTGDLIFKQSGTPGERLHVQVIAGSPARLHIRRDGSTTDAFARADLSAFAAWGTAKWLTFAGVWNFNGASTANKLFVGDETTDAAEPSSYNSRTAGAGTALNIDSGQLRWGGDESSLYWNGPIAAGALFNGTELSNAEIVRLLRLWRDPRQWVRTGLTGLWLPGAHGVTAAPDLSGNGHNGTMSGGAYHGGPAARSLWQVAVDVTAAGATAVQASVSIAVESQQGLHPALAAPWESVRSLASSTPAPTEQLASANGSSPASWEALGGIRNAPAVPWESSQGLAAPSASAWESLRTIPATQSTSWESLLGLAQSTAAPWEAEAGVTRAQSTPWEALAGVLATQTPAWESLAGVRASVPIPWEALSAAIAVSQSVAIPIEWAGPVTQVTQVATEALRSLMAESAAPWETSAPIAGVVTIPAESLASITVSASPALEWLASAERVHVIPLAWEGRVAAAVVIPVAWKSSILPGLLLASIELLPALAGTARLEPALSGAPTLEPALGGSARLNPREDP